MLKPLCKVPHSEQRLLNLTNTLLFESDYNHNEIKLQINISNRTSSRSQVLLLMKNIYSTYLKVDFTKCESIFA